MGMNKIYQLALDGNRYVSKEISSEIAIDAAVETLIANRKLVFTFGDLHCMHFMDCKKRSYSISSDTFLNLFDHALSKNGLSAKSTDEKRQGSQSSSTEPGFKEYYLLNAL